MKKSLVKWHQVNASDINRISDRLSHMTHNPPSQVPKLLSYGWTHMKETIILRTEIQYVEGVPLFLKNPSFTPADRRIVIKLIDHQIQLWKAQNFIHGDLSTRNILVKENALKAPKLWFTDWILDLQSFAGTPQNAHPDIFRGVHSSKTDAFAASKIIKEIKTQLG